MRGRLNEDNNKRRIEKCIMTTTGCLHPIKILAIRDYYVCESCGVALRAIKDGLLISYVEVNTGEGTES